MSKSPLVTDWLIAGATILSMLAVATTALIAIGTLKAREQDSQMRSRPVMYARFVPTPLGCRHIDFEIGNAGASVAKNILVTFDPPDLILPDDARKSQLADLLQGRYQRSLSTWVPGQPFRSGYFVGDDQERRQNLEPLPDELTVIIEYEDDRNRPYCDQFDLNIRPVLDETRVTNRKEGKLDHQQPWGRYVTEALETIARQMR